MRTQRTSPSKTQTARRAFAVLTVVSSLGLSTGSRAATSPDFVAHEWGTFTSIQGGDGKLFSWDSIATSELPPFVYNWSHAGLGRFSSLFLVKSGLTGSQRMETPVIYFYSKQPLTVDVAVQFPKGNITEWFPQAAEIGPSFHAPGGLITALDKAATSIGLNTSPSLATRLNDPPVTNSVIHWKNFLVLPMKENSGLTSQLPTAEKASHYFAARETDAAFVRVDSLEPTNPAPEIEKFLFYRGVGNFPAPLNVTMNEQGELSAFNAGNEPLKHLFAIAVHGDRASVMPLGNLAMNQTRTARLDETAGKPVAETVKKLRGQMADALEAEGLYRAEAEAMVNTWRDAWFEDQGVRVLYILPRKWTDATLPITMTPPPRELVRVMVGRAEIITPGMAQQVARCVEGFRQSDDAAKLTAVNEFKAMKLGRFAYVAVQVAGARVTDKKFIEDGLRLIEAAAKSEPATVSAEPARRLAATGG